MPSTVFVGGSSSTLAEPGSLWRVSVRGTFSFGRFVTPRNWTSDVERFVENLPGSGVVFAIGSPWIDQEREVAVVDLRIMTVLPPPGAVTLGDLVRVLDRFLPGAEVLRLERLERESLGDVATNRQQALETAAAEDAERDNAGFLAQLERWLKSGLLVVLVIGALVLLAYAGILKQRTAS